MNEHDKKNIIFFVILAAIIIFTLIFFKTSSAGKNPRNNSAPENITKTELQHVKSEKANMPKVITNIKINPMMKFSGMNKDEILALRIKAVKNSSLFSSISDYKPNPDIYQIDDGYPWIGAYEISCNGMTPNIGEGASRESAGILNPELLFYIDIPDFGFSKKNIPCGKEDYMIPYKLVYDPEFNKITASVDYYSLGSKSKAFYPIYFHDANAHDLGYNFVYADITKNIKFLNEQNISNTVVQTKGFYHRGFSCELPEGCNNYSPYEPTYGFRLTKLPAEINLKLWKKQPSSTSQSADINYTMIFK